MNINMKKKLRVLEACMEKVMKQCNIDPPNFEEDDESSLNDAVVDDQDEIEKAPGKTSDEDEVMVHTSIAEDENLNVGEEVDEITKDVGKVEGRQVKIRVKKMGQLCECSCKD